MRSTSQKVFGERRRKVLSTARIVKIRSGKYFAEIDGKVTECTAKGSLKIKADGIVTGDFVTVENGVITGVMPRKNRLYRPNVANVDVVAIVVGSPPVPDFYLIDKLISVCFLGGTEVVIVVNKLDIDGEIAKKIIENYSGAVGRIFQVSAKTGDGLNEFSEYVKGKLVVLTGQSAVGKTSVLNKFFGHDGRVGELSEKTKRGKQTTTVSEIVNGGGAKLMDTPGFTSLEISVKAEDLPEAYPEFIPYLGKCRFTDCKHLKEPDCMIKRAVEEGKINKERYLRYTEIYKEAKEGKNYGKRN